jgi:hypothetical protein
MSYILPFNIFPPTAKPYDSRTVSDSPTITVTRAKGIYATDAPTPRESPALYSKPFITLAPQEATTPRETALTYPQTKAIKTLTANETEVINDYVKQP